MQLLLKLNFWNAQETKQNRQKALAALRGAGRALPLLPDAREVLLLGGAAFSPAVHLDYGRAPDARLPGTA